jgi:hypothetical protein
MKHNTMPTSRKQPVFIFGTHARGAMAGSLCAALLLMAGCQARPEFRPLTSEAPPPPVFATVPADEACQAVQARYALGRSLDPLLLEEMRTRTGSRSARPCRRRPIRRGSMSTSTRRGLWLPRAAADRS